METLVLSQKDVSSLLDLSRLSEVLADGFRALSTEGQVVAPPRSKLETENGGLLLTKPAYRKGGPIAVKLVTVFPGNEALGLPSHLALISVMDADTGATLALMDGTHITAVRTAGAAVLAANLLARPESSVLTVLGAGVQGRWHLELMQQAFPLTRIHVASRRSESAERLAALSPMATVTTDVEAAVRGSDIVCMCSHSPDPLVPLEWVQPGQHLSSVGWAPPAGELDPRIPQEHGVFVETSVAFAPPPAGCSELQDVDPAQGAELGEVLLGTREGRVTEDQITVYKSMGHAIEDLVVAAMVYERANEVGAGQKVEL